MKDRLVDINAEDFTREEMEVVEQYLFAKLCRLEDCGLEDSRCYPAIYSFRHKIMRKLRAMDPNYDETKLSIYGKNSSQTK